jgi:hypothetical protein
MTLDICLTSVDFEKWMKFFDNYFPLIIDDCLVFSPVAHQDLKLIKAIQHSLVKNKDACLNGLKLETESGPIF